MIIAAMKQALDTLEEINKLSIGENAICLPAEIDTAMDSLRQAIEQAEKQEPVAWRFRSGTWFNREVDWRYINTLEGAEGLLGLEPLYTSPPPRQPLTDEEISDLWCKVSNTDFVTADTHEFARAIEAAHGIKGEA